MRSCCSWASASLQSNSWVMSSSYVSTGNITNCPPSPLDSTGTAHPPSPTSQEEFVSATNDGLHPPPASKSTELAQIDDFAEVLSRDADAEDFRLLTVALLKNRKSRPSKHICISTETFHAATASEIFTVGAVVTIVNIFSINVYWREKRTLMNNPLIRNL